MSLLEDIFLQDETEESRALEQVIEGQDNYEVINSDNDSIKGDEAEEDKRTVDPTQTKKRNLSKNPRFLLNPARLTGPRGIQVIPDHFKDFRFKGKGHEKEDLDLMLKKLEHWAYRLYPKFEFADCLKKIETLGRKRPVMVHLKKLRSDQFVSGETVVQQDSSDEDLIAKGDDEDEFDKLLQQQIDKAKNTPAPSSIKKLNHGPIATMPKATSSPSINDEQRERMIRNRKLAEERRLSRLNNSKADKENVELTENNDLNNFDLKLNTGNDLKDDKSIDNNDTDKGIIEIEKETPKNASSALEINNRAMFDAIKNLDNSKSNEEYVGIGNNQSESYNLESNIDDRVKDKKSDETKIIDNSDEEMFVCENVEVQINNCSKPNIDDNNIVSIENLTDSLELVQKTNDSLAFQSIDANDENMMID